MSRAAFLEGMAPSATLAINERSKALQAQGKQVFRFGLGQSPFPVPDPVVEALQANASEKDYLHVAGLPALREAVAQWHQRMDGIEASPEGVLIGPGSKELLFVTQLVYEAELLLPSPCWVSYAPQARIAGRSVRLIHTTWADRWRLTPAALDAACAGVARPRLLILNAPGNPEGLSYTADELAELSEVLRKHGILVISDEIYGPLHHTNGHVSLARFYPEGTLVAGGLSKWCGAGGWRLGTMVVPPQLHWIWEAACVVASETFSAVSAPIQHAACTAYAPSAQMDEYLDRCRKLLAVLAPRCTAPLQAVGAQIHNPTGAFYFLADLEPLRERLATRGVESAHQLAMRVLEESGVAILPGQDFMRPATELSFRLAYVDFDGRSAMDALADGRSAHEVVEAHCGDTTAGIARLADWLSA